MERLELRITGRVQGVGYRWHAREEALRLGLTGRARNRADGSVQVLAEGLRPSLTALVEWAWHGPARARVEAVEVVWSTAEGTWEDFTITG